MAVLFFDGTEVNIMLGKINSAEWVDMFEERRVEKAPENKSSKSYEARQKALQHIENGTKAILDKIFNRIELEAEVGRFQLLHTLKNNEAHLKERVVERLIDEGFKVDVGSTTQRETEVSLNISW